MQIKVKDLNLTSYDKVVLLIKDKIKKKIKRDYCIRFNGYRAKDVISFLVFITVGTMKITELFEASCILPDGRKNCGD